MKFKTSINGEYKNIWTMRGKRGPQGEQGKTGRTPQKGVDYWTADDRQDIIDRVLYGGKGLQRMLVSDYQYIDTEFKPTTSTKVEMKIQVIPRVVGYQGGYEKWAQTLFGCRTDYKNNEYSLWVDYSGQYNISSGLGTIVYAMAGYNTDTPSTAAYPAYNKDCVITMEQGRVTFAYDETSQVRTFSVVGSISSSAPNLWLFNLNCPKEPKNLWTNGLWYYTKIWDNGELVRDFIPARDDNGVVCMYDQVTERYFYNKGEGEFFLA
jgi:hypothetical protein